MSRSIRIPEKQARPQRIVGRCSGCRKVHDLPGGAQLFLLGTTCPTCRRGIVLAERVTDRRANAGRHSAWTARASRRVRTGRPSPSGQPPLTATPPTAKMAP
jgi:hypothetical protein